MTTSLRTTTIDPGRTYRIAGATRRIIMGSVIEASLEHQWSNVTLWRASDALPADWPADDPAIPLALGSWPIWIQATYLGTSSQAPSSILVTDDAGTTIDTIAVAAVWTYDASATTSTTPQGALQFRVPARPPQLPSAPIPPPVVSPGAAFPVTTGDTASRVVIATAVGMSALAIAFAWAKWGGR